MLNRIIVFGFTLVSLNVALKASDTIAPTPEKVAFFESKIRPLLVANCVKCHGEKSAKGGLRLDSKPGWLKGGDTGEVILPGNPDESLLIKAVRFADKTLQMPPKKKLADHEIALLTDWVRQGAIDPRSKEVTAHHGMPGRKSSKNGSTGGASSVSMILNHRKWPIQPGLKTLLTSSFETLWIPPVLTVHPLPSPSCSCAALPWY